MSDPVFDIPGLMYHLPQVVSRHMNKHQERQATAMADLHAKSSFGQVMGEVSKLGYGLCLVYVIVSLFIPVYGNEKPNQLTEPHKENSPNEMRLSYTAQTLGTINLTDVAKFVLEHPIHPEIIALFMAMRFLAGKPRHLGQAEASVAKENCKSPPSRNWCWAKGTWAIQDRWSTREIG